MLESHNIPDCRAPGTWPLKSDPEPETLPQRCKGRKGCKLDLVTIVVVPYVPRLPMFTTAPLDVSGVTWRDTATAHQISPMCRELDQRNRGLVTSASDVFGECQKLDLVYFRFLSLGVTTRSMRMQCLRA